MARNSKVWDIVKSCQYSIGDVVVLAHRRKDGYPQSLEFGEDYYINDIDGDFIKITDDRSMLSSSALHAKIHKLYLLPKYFLRDLKIKSLLNF